MCVEKCDKNASNLKLSVLKMKSHQHDRIKLFFRRIQKKKSITVIELLCLDNTAVTIVVRIVH